MGSGGHALWPARVRDQRSKRVSAEFRQPHFATIKLKQSTSRGHARGLGSRPIHRRPARSHAEAVHTLEPAAGTTAALVDFTGALAYDALPEEARHYARRHLLDTVGVMIAGAPGTIATQAENVIKSVRPAGGVP